MASGILLFVASLDKNIDDEFLRKQFEQFGPLFRASVVRDEFQASKSFGFVHFVSKEDGLKAIKEMNGKTLLRREIHVNIANSQETTHKNMASGINLFVASLDKNIDDEFLRKQFEQFGPLFSASVTRDDFQVSKGFGFVHFISKEDGLRAIKEMNGKTLLTREIHVDIANSQERRCYNAANESIWANELDRGSVYECESLLDVLSVSSDVPGDQDRSGTSDVKERMKRLFETQSFTDVTFYPKNNRKVFISAHRAILAVGSPLFTKMLFGGDNKDTPGIKMEVEISNMSFGAFTNIVKYLYTDEVFFESDSLVKDILEGAKEFEIPSLVNRCKKYFETLELSNENVCSKLELSISDKIGLLKERCIEFIQKNTLPVINSADFQKCSPATVRTICKLQSLNLRREAELLDAVVRWLQAQPLLTRKQMVQPIMKCIRFLTFNATELGDALKMYPDLLTSEDGLKIILYLYNPPKAPDSSSLPSWCNKNTLSRCYFSEDRLGPQTGLNVFNPADRCGGKITFPLKTVRVERSYTQLTSLLQLKCVAGRHQLKAIRLSFHGPVSERSLIGNLTINVHVHPSGFKTSEQIQIGNSESVSVTFKRIIKARTGDLVDIEVEAKDIRFYRFLQFDESGCMPRNRHFQCCISSRPKEGKLYFIRELEYSPQFINRENVYHRR